MENPQPQDPSLADMTVDYYSADPLLGDIVFLRHNFEDASIRGVVTGVHRKHPHRGYDADGNYEVVIYQELRIKIAGVKGWLDLSDDSDGWEITDSLRGVEYNKLEARVVVETIASESDEEH